MLKCQKDGCDRSWDQDPVFMVGCPSCEAGPGEKCKRPSGHPVWNPGWSGLPKGAHPKRDLKALEEGKYGTCPTGKCPDTLDELDAKKKREAQACLSESQEPKGQGSEERVQMSLFDAAEPAGKVPQD